MQETYTFSRALHLMRYGGKITQSTLDDKERFTVVAGQLMRSIKVAGEWTIPLPTVGLRHDWIMSSWIEVRP